MLQTAPQSSPELFSMLPSAIGLLEYDIEGLRKILKIIESYLLLDGQTTLQVTKISILMLFFFIQLKD